MGDTYKPNPYNSAAPPLSAAAIAGITVGVALVVLLLAVLVYRVWLSCHNGQAAQAGAAAAGGMLQLSAVLPPVLVVVAYPPEEAAVAPQEGDVCPICLQEYVAGEEVSLLECGHYFHHVCASLAIAARRRCPLCNQVVA